MLAAHPALPLQATEALVNLGFELPFALDVLRRDRWMRLLRVRCGAGSGQALLTAVAPDAPAFIHQRMRRAAEIAPGLDASFAVRPLSLLADDAEPCLLQEDPGGSPLDGERRQALPVGRAVQLARSLAQAVDGCHASGLVHNDLRPANILVREDGSVRLLGFGRASRAGEPGLPLVLTDAAEALPYMSPERTGRMNRAVDTRSDLYALGVVLYELLAGQLPFAADSPMEWVHCHVARAPVPLQDRLPACPPPLLAIVDKLLAKAAEHRFQTAAELVEALDRSACDWHPGAQAAPAQLQRLALPRRLHGRERPSAALQAAYQRVRDSGRAELLLVAGHSGVGKSALVHALQRDVAAQGGLFAAGKFGQDRQDAPYAPLAQGLGAVLAELLQRGDAARAHWKSRLGAALGANAASLQGMLPELAQLLGAGAAPHGLSPTDATQRFLLAITGLVAALAEPGKPLVLFIDDLQWLDASTLEVLLHLATHEELGRLLLVGAYRSNEVGADHALHRLTAATQARGVGTTRVSLDRLPAFELQALVADALDRPPEQIAALAQHLHGHTDGNPFFALQLLRTLADDGLLQCDPRDGVWRWDLDAIVARDHQNDVREFLVARLARLPGPARYWVETLSCFGASATLRCMAVACGGPADAPEAWQAQADAATQAGLVHQADGVCRFVHDRIQEAAYALMPPALRPYRHLEIARRLGAALSAEEADRHLFDIAHQLAPGLALLTETPERLRAAALFHRAGARAQKETAYGAALRHLAHADTLLGPGRWEDAYELALAVGLALAECRFLVGELQAAEQLLLELQQRARHTVDRAAVTWLQVTLYTALDRSDQAIRTCLQFLGGAGIAIPASPGEAEVMQEYQTLLAQLEAGGGPRALLALPPASDPEQRAVLDALASMLPPAFFSDANLVCYALCRMARLSLAHGQGDASALAYAYLGMVIGPRFSAYGLAFELGRVGYELVEREPLHRYRGRVYMTYAYHVCAWARPLDNSLELLRRAYQIAREGGDVTYAGFSSCTLVTTLLSQGTHLAEVQREARERLRYVKQAKFGLVDDIITVQLQLVATLRGETRELGVFDNDGFSEREYESRLTANPNLDIATCWYWIRKAHARFLANRFAEALAALERAEPLLWTSAGHFEMAQYHFGAALVRTECCHGASAARRAELLAHVDRHLAQLRTWAANSPETFNFRVALVEAALAELHGSAMQALQAHDRALAQARQLGAPQQIALALENMARCCRRAGLAGMAQGLLAQSRDEYLRWGATAKAARMERELPALLRPRAPAEAAPGAFEDADVAAMLKTSQAVGHDAGLDELMRALMEIALEHAGANRGVLILPRGDQLRTEALAHFGAEGAEVRLQSAPVAATDLPLAVLRHVVRTAGTVLLDDARQSAEFAADPYIVQGRCRAVLCLPLIRQKELIAVLYLENSLVSHVFTPSRVALLKLLVVTAALYIENAALEEKESLLKEVHHRVKNNLQLISSLLSLQAARTGDAGVAELFAESRNRVRSMALVHENLYRAGNFARVPMPAHIRNLCAELARAYGTAAQNVAVAVEVDDVQLDLDRAVSCGLIVNELLSNALKHAFRAGGGGTVQVGLRVREGGQCELRVADDGAGLPADLDVARAATLGLQLVDDLTAQLHGVLNVRRGPGADFRIRFPASDARVLK